MNPSESALSCWAGEKNSKLSIYGQINLVFPLLKRAAYSSDSCTYIMVIDESNEAQYYLSTTNYDRNN